MPVETTTVCLDAEELAAFVDGRLSGSRREQVMEHLARCGRCYEVFAGVVQSLEEERAEGAGEGEVVPFSERRGTLRAIPWRAALAAAVAAVAVGTGAYLYRLLAPAPALVAGDLVAPLGAEIRSYEGRLWPEATRGAGPEAALISGCFQLGARLVDIQASLAADRLDKVSFPLHEVRRLLADDLQSFVEEATVEQVREAAARLEGAATAEERRAAAAEIERALDGYFTEEGIPDLAFGKWVEAGRLSALLGDPAFFRPGNPGRRYLRWLLRHRDEVVYPEAVPELEKISEIVRRPALGPEDYQELVQAFKSIASAYQE